MSWATAALFYRWKEGAFVKKEWRAGMGCWSWSRAGVGSVGLDWKPGVVARLNLGLAGKVLSLVNNLPSGTVSLLEIIKRERRHLLDRREKEKCTYLKSSG